MGKRISFAKRIWRSLLRWYYHTEKRILSDRNKLEWVIGFFTKLPIQRNKIVMDNINGRGYGENPKYIAEELLHRGGKKSKIIWFTNDNSLAFPAGITPVGKNTLRAYYESATAKAWVFNCRFGKLTKKRKNQVLLQTWHGGLAIKKVEKDAEDRLSSWYVSQAIEDGQTVDGIVVDSKPNEEIFLRAFWLNQDCELLKCGSPRVDILIHEKDNQDIKKRVRSALGIDEDAFFVLYAPTFRKQSTVENYISSFDDILKAFESRFGKTTIAYRLHPNAERLMGSVAWGRACAVNATMFPDVQELIIAADCLITDYSSIAYDFALIRKPVFLCVKDTEEYIEERGVYDIFYEQPFSLNKSEEALIRDIQSCSLDEMRKKVDLFYKKYPSYNTGMASKEIVKWLEKKGFRILTRRVLCRKSV